jgi:hypothetical protein
MASVAFGLLGDPAPRFAGKEQTTPELNTFQRLGGSERLSEGDDFCSLLVRKDVVVLEPPKAALLRGSEFAPPCKLDHIIRAAVKDVCYVL